MSFHQGQIVVRKWSKAKVLKRRLFVVLHQNGRIVNLMDAYGKATQLEYYRVETLDDAKADMRLQWIVPRELTQRPKRACTM